MLSPHGRMTVAVAATGVLLGGCLDDPLTPVSTTGAFHPPYSAAAASTSGIPVFAVREVGGTVARALNEQGDAAGWGTIGGNARAFLYTPEAGTIYLPLPTGTTMSTAWDLSGRDAEGVVEVVGSAYRDVLDEPGRALRWRVSARGSVLEIRDLGVLEGDAVSEARGINDSGVIVGYSNPRSFLSVRPFRFTEAEGLTQLATGGLSGYALDINEAGTITGYSGLQAFRVWPDGRAETLTGTPASFPHSTGHGINERNQVAGSLISNSEITGNRVARYTDGVGWEILGGIGHSRTENIGWAIDDQGTVVGRGMISSPGPRGVIYRDDIGSLVYIDDLLAAEAAGWTVTYAHDINGSGQIAGGGTHASGAMGGGIVLTPVGTYSPPAAPSGMTARARPATAGVPYNSIVVEWVDNSDDETAFRLERRDSPGGEFRVVAQPTSTSFTDGDIALCAPYEYRVQAYNHAGASAYAGPVGTRAPCEAPDTTPPTMTFVQPLDGATVSGRVEVVVEATDDRGSVSLRLYVDGAYLCDAASSPLSCTWNARKAEAGPHTLLARAYDAMSNAAQATIEVQIPAGEPRGGKGGKKGG